MIAVVFLAFAGLMFWLFVKSVKTRKRAGLPMSSGSMLAKDGHRFLDISITETGQVKAGTEGGPIVGAVATIQTGAQLSGMTAGRVLTLGVLALAAKKMSQEMFLLIEAPSWALIRPVPAKHQADARRFAVQFNVRARAAVAASNMPAIVD